MPTLLGGFLPQLPSRRALLAGVLYTFALIMFTTPVVLMLLTAIGVLPAWGEPAVVLLVGFLFGMIAAAILNRYCDARTSRNVAIGCASVMTVGTLALILFAPTEYGFLQDLATEGPGGILLPWAAASVVYWRTRVLVASAS